MTPGHEAGERTETYSVTLRYGVNGFPYGEPVPGARLRAEQRGGSVALTGNPEGLTCLAHALLGLARMTAASERQGYHLHVEEECGLAPEGVQLIVYLESEDGRGRPS
jgi:hypothetical protein